MERQLGSRNAHVHNSRLAAVVCRWDSNVLAVRDPSFQPATDGARPLESPDPEPNPWLLRLGLSRRVCQDVLNPGGFGLESLMHYAVGGAPIATLCYQLLFDRTVLLLRTPHLATAACLVASNRPAMAMAATGLLA